MRVRVSESLGVIFVMKAKKEKEKSTRNKRIR